ncbi:unnamed protein product [Candida verbasci]|uniref:CID domain-containing protein n=1 Tax=Candida verbasci TaxID=1227364 RepID=A0A9W4U053_9ASCO|nr:unnamed protein product [Candida verbasci]
MSNDLIRQYETKLNQLTFNSRPIIDELTIVAKDNPIIADQIVDLIKNRIYKAVPDQKLFILYLLDSICKTVGNPYNIFIADEVYDLYTHVFQFLNDTLRNKMVNLLNTWKEMKTISNDPLFPEEELAKIEEFIKKAGYPKNIIPEAQQLLINDITQIIPIFENKIKTNPTPKLQERYTALGQLKTMLSNQVITPAELAAVQNHLHNIKQQELRNSNTPTPAATPAPTPAQVTQPPIQVQVAQVVEPQRQASLPPKPQSRPQTNSGPPSLPPVPQIPKINIAIGLFNDLLLSGLVKKDQEPIPGSKPTYSLVFPETKYSPMSNNEEVSISQLEDILLASSGVARSEYEKLKFGEILTISKKTKTNDQLQQFINSNKPSSSMINLLYEDKPKKCPTCGKRFTDDTDGLTKHRLHFDWHFRINKKISTKGGNIQSRNWYLDDYDWVHFKDENLLEFSTTETIMATPEVEMNVTQPGSQYVVVPPNDTNMINRCVICREQVKATYNDEVGEWCWLDCIRVPGEPKNSRKIVHISCFNESNKKRSAETELNTNVKREKL